MWVDSAGSPILRAIGSNCGSLPDRAGIPRCHHANRAGFCWEVPIDDLNDPRISAYKPQGSHLRYWFAALVMGGIWYVPSRMAACGWYRRMIGRNGAAGAGSQLLVSAGWSCWITMVSDPSLFRRRPGRCPRP